MVTLASLWWLFATLFAGSLGYIYWKFKGGNILFRFKKSDDGSTQFWKALLYLGWTYGSVVVAMGIALVTLIMLVASGVANLSLQ